MRKNCLPMGARFAKAVMAPVKNPSIPEKMLPASRVQGLFRNPSDPHFVNIFDVNSAMARGFYLKSEDPGSIFI